MTSPTQRTLAECKKRGWIAQVVEKWNPHARIRQDLFGCIDIVACTAPTLDEFGSIIGIQACAGSSHAARRAKAIRETRLWRWLEAGGRFQVWSWSKQGARGKRKLWTLRTEEITSENALKEEA